MFKKRDMPRTFCIEKYSIGIIGVLLSFFMLLIVILAEIVFLATNNWKAPTALFVIFGIILVLFLGLLVFTSLILIRYFLCDCFGTAITAKIVGREELQILRVSLFDSEDYNFRLVIEYKGTNGKTYRSKFSVSRYVYENRCIGDDIHVFRYKKYAVSKLL